MLKKYLFLVILVLAVSDMCSFGSYPNVSSISDNAEIPIVNDIVHAATRGHWDKVKELLAEHPELGFKKYRMEETLLHSAACNGRVAVVAYLLEILGEEFESDYSCHSPRRLFDACDALHNETPLFLAARFGHWKVVKLLLDHGASVACRNWKNQTALHVAAEEGYVSIVSLLLERGAELEALDEHGKTPCYLASEKGYQDVVIYLIWKGADINAFDLSGETSLFFAAQKGDLAIVKFLVEQNSNVNATCSHGTTALFAACEQGHLNVVKFLVSKGIEIDAHDHLKQTCLYYAIFKKHLMIVSYLIERYACLAFNESQILLKTITPRRFSSWRRLIQARRMALIDSLAIHFPDDLCRLLIDFVLHRHL